MTNQHNNFAAEVLLKRFDTYISGINSKSAFLIAFNTFILGTLVVKLQDVSAIFLHPKITSLLPFVIFLIFVGATSSLFFALQATYPILETGNKSAEYHSLIFFGSIAQMEQQTFIKRMADQTESSLFEDLMRQCHCLADCAQKKHLLIKKSINSVKYGVLLPIVFMAFLKILEYFITS